MSANVRRVAITAAGLSATLALAGTAQARITKISVGVRGTQRARAHVADSGCSDQPGVVATGDMTESFSLRTYRRMILTVLPGVNGSLGFDREFTRNSQEILTRGTVTRTSTLSPDGQAMIGGCGGGPPASCGTRPFARLALQAGGAATLRGRFLGIGIENAATTPKDPFSACAGPLGGPPVLFPDVPTTGNNGRSRFYASIPASFLKSCRHGTMTRSLDGTVPDHVTGTTTITGGTTLHLSVTVTQLGCLRGIR